MLVVGGKTISEVYYGKVSIKAIYKGVKLLWKRGEFTNVFSSQFCIKSETNGAL